MDAVFQGMNTTLSTSGEQVLYHQLRAPAQSQQALLARIALADDLSRDEALRLSAMDVLSRLGKRRGAETVEAFAPKERSALSFWLTLGLVLLLLALVVLTVALPDARNLLMALLMLSAGGNALFHTLRLHKMERDLATVNYSASVVRAAGRLRKIMPDGWLARFPGLDEAITCTRPILRQGGLQLASATDFATFVNVFLLLDLLSYERLKNGLWRFHQEIFLLHEFVGAVDAALAVASLRVRTPLWCVPEISFDPADKAYLDIAQMGHPLLANPVRNDVCLEGAALVTGSNASGKSTFLKAAALCALLAQAVGFVHAKAYRGTAVRLYTSMAITDDVEGGESYFIAEMKSIRRIVQAASQGERVLCAIDEVLRGTNTVERIAASSELLKALAQSGVLCLAATHDGELCGMLSEAGYVNWHFEEHVADGTVTFDYLRKDGPATGRNAIRLLSLMGFDEGIVARADAKAKKYLREGIWQDG